MHGQKALFGGIQSQGSAGAIQVIPYPFAEENKLDELQLHDSPLTKIALNYEHSLVFTGAEDGSLSILAITDRPKGSLRDVTTIHEVLIQGKLHRKLLEESKEKEKELKERKKDSEDRINAFRNEKQREINNLTHELQREEHRLN